MKVLIDISEDTFNHLRNNDAMKGEDLFRVTQEACKAVSAGSSLNTSGKILYLSDVIDCINRNMGCTVTKLAEKLMEIPDVTDNSNNHKCCNWQNGECIARFITCTDNYDCPGFD